MIAGGGSTTDYWELEKQAQWLGKRGEKQKKRPTYEKSRSRQGMEILS